ncbi:MAG: phenylacetate--CoA ligase family protein [Bacillota bacterium]
MNRYIKNALEKFPVRDILAKRLLDELSTSQYYTMEKLEAVQNYKLGKIIKHCYESVPYYTDLFNSLKLKPQDIKTKEDLKKLPLMDKATIRENFDKLLSKKRNKVLCSCETSSGTTGILSKIVRDITCVRYESAALKRFWQSAGDMGSKRVVLRGGIVVPGDIKEPPFWEYNRLNNELVMSSFHLFYENSKHYVNEIVNYRPEVVYAYPSTAYLAARFFADEGIKLKLKAVFTSSETLSDYQRELIQEVFDCRVYDWYGQSERVSAIGQCEMGTYHIIEDYSITEIIPSQEGNEIVGTHLYNYAMPLIRYRTCDIVELSDKKCSCGRHFRVVDRVLGRKSSYIMTLDGKKVSATLLGYFIKYVDSINEIQFVQEKKGEVVINITTNSKFEESDREKIINITKEHMGKEMNVELNILDIIPRGSNGKYTSVINKIEC